jgi:dihydropteroate synthase
MPGPPDPAASRRRPDLGGPPGDAAAPGRDLPRERGVVPPDPVRGGGAATPSFAARTDRPLDPPGPPGLPGRPAPLAIGPRTFAWGSRTFVMGILNVTPDSFSGDGLLAADGDPVRAAVALASLMAAEGADLLDVGGESSRPGHASVSVADELARVLPVIRALRAALPEMPLSVDTTKPAVADAALAAGAHLLNDVWGVAANVGIARVAAAHGVPLIVMHNRAEAHYVNLVPEILADLQRALERAIAVGVAWERLIVDPGFGFGKAPLHNLALLRDLGSLRLLGRPILLGTSRKSTLGKVLDLPPDERTEATLATTVLGIASGVDMLRVHDVRPNVRAARMADAIVRGWDPDGSA